MIKSNCIVESTKGKDIGKLYIVSNINGNFAYLCDGKVKNKGNLKKKNVKHLKSILLSFLPKMTIKKGIILMMYLHIIKWLLKLTFQI